MKKKERERLSAAKIEARCVTRLKKMPSLKHIRYAKIRPHKGDKGWTWEMYEAGPNGASALAPDAISKINDLQSAYDLDAR
jgi:hypothetical protein